MGTKSKTNWKRIKNIVLIIGCAGAIVLCVLFALAVKAVFAAPVEPEPNPNAPAVINEPLPGCSEDPACPKEWYVERDFSGDTGYLVDDLQDPKWRIRAICQDPLKPAPVRGTYCIMTGSRKLDCEGGYQDLLALEVVDKPDEPEEPDEWKFYLPWNQALVRAACTCIGHTAIVLVDGQFAFEIDLKTFPDMGWDDYFVNLYPGQEVEVFFRWYGQPASEDDVYLWSTVQINCDNKEPVTITAVDNYVSWGCDAMNGTSDCRFTFTTQTCELCRGRSLGTDPKPY